jgi:hypothetical protein
LNGDSVASLVAEAPEGISLPWSEFVRNSVKQSVAENAVNDAVIAAKRLADNYPGMSAISATEGQSDW